MPAWALSASTVRCRAVGMPWRLMNSLAKSLLPSRQRRRHRAEDCHAGAFQSLAQAFHQGVFRAYDHQIDGVVGHGSGNGGEIIGGKEAGWCHRLRFLRCGCDEKLAQTRAAGYSACESRFAASASEQ